MDTALRVRESIDYLLVDEYPDGVHVALVVPSSSANHGRYLPQLGAVAA
jgi:hypothetical protein